MQFHHHFEKNTKGRDFIVGDIHANIKRLRTALESVDFDESQDRLFSIGDLIDRGSNNLTILKMLYEKPWFYAIRGNHEQMLIDRFELPRISPGLAQAKTRFDAEYLHQHNGGRWFDNLRSSLAKQRIYQNLSALPYAITLETEYGDIGLVHAEVPEICNSWEGFLERLEDDKRVRHECIWNRDAIMDVFDPYAGDYFVEQYERVVEGILATIHGHTPVKKPIVCGNQVWIDTGHKTGRLTIVEAGKVMDFIAQNIGV
jgi:serine/threonine protein phosphatase 1